MESNAATKTAEETADRRADQDRQQHQELIDVGSAAHDHGVQQPVFHLLVGDERGRDNDARGEGVARANRTVGMPASAPPIMGRKSTRVTHSGHSSGKGTPRRVSVTLLVGGELTADRSVGPCLHAQYLPGGDVLHAELSGGASISACARRPTGIVFLVCCARCPLAARRLHSRSVRPRRNHGARPCRALLAWIYQTEVPAGLPASITGRRLDLRAHERTAEKHGRRRRRSRCHRDLQPLYPPRGPI